MDENDLKKFKRNPTTVKYFGNILNCISLDKLHEARYISPAVKNFKEIGENLVITGVTFNETQDLLLKAFTRINDNLNKCYIEIVPATDGTRVYGNRKYHLNIPYDDFLTEQQMTKSNCLSLIQFLDLREIDRVTKTIGDLEFSRDGIKRIEKDVHMAFDPEKSDVIKRLIKHYSSLYRSEDEQENEKAFLDILELLRVRPRDKALWLNVTGGFGKDVLIALVANFWNQRIFSGDINDNMQNAPRVKEERELERTNAQIWNRPELKENASREDIEARVQSIKTHTGRTSDIIEVKGDVRVNSAFTIETTNADLQLRNDPDVARRFIVFKMEANSLTDMLTPKEIEDLIAGEYDNELECLYYNYVVSGENKSYMERLERLSTPLEQVIDEEMKDARAVVPASWAKYQFIPKQWVDACIENNAKKFEGKKLKEKISMLGLGGSETMHVKHIQIDMNDAKIRQEISGSTTVRVNKYCNKNAEKVPVIKEVGAFDEDGMFIKA